MNRKAHNGEIEYSPDNVFGCVHAAVNCLDPNVDMHGLSYERRVLYALIQLKMIERALANETLKVTRFEPDHVSYRIMKAVAEGTDVKEAIRGKK